MDLATIFRLEENLNLDRKTLVFLRWIAIFGQLFSVNLVYFFFRFKFSYITLPYSNFYRFFYKYLFTIWIESNFAKRFVFNHIFGL